MSLRSRLAAPGTRDALLALGFFLALAFLFTAPLSLSPASQAANEGDPLHISWILAWVVHQLTTHPFQLFESNAFYPYPRSLAFSEHLTVEALMVGPVYLLSGNALLAQNIAVLLAFALSGWAMFLLLREMVGHSDAALVGGLLYAFHSYTLQEVPRLQVLSIQWWPLAVLFLYRAFRSGRWRDAALFGLFFLLQGLSCTYYLIYFSMMMLLWIPGVFLWARRKGAVRPLGKVSAALFVAGIVLSLFALPYLKMFSAFGYQRSLAEGLDLLDYIKPPEGTPFSFWIDFEIKTSATQHFIGFGALLLLLVGLTVGVSRAKESSGGGTFLWLSLLTGLVGFVVSLGPIVYVGGRAVGPGAYAVLYEYVPLFRGLRSPERIAILVNFAVGVIGAYGAAVLFRRLPRRAASWLMIAFLIALPFEHFSGGVRGVGVPTGDKVPEVYRWLAEESPDDSGGPVIELPVYPLRKHRFYAAYMFYSTYHWRPIVLGRTSFYPPAMEYLAWQLRDFPDRDSLGLLRWLGVRTIVVHPELWPEPERGRRLAALKTMGDEMRLTGVFPHLEGPDYQRFGFGGEHVYTLQGAPPEVEDLCEPRDEITTEDWAVLGSSAVPAEWAIDRDPRTRWETDRQIPGDSLTLNLGRTEPVAAVRLALGFPYEQFPRYLGVRARTGDGAWRPFPYRDDLATKLELLRALVENPSDAAFVLRFEPEEAGQLRFRVGGQRYDYAIPGWSLPELYVYRSCSL
ncbi:MAG: hypothetical protein ACRD1X_08565 [Vicinamibacteria bacterium]